MAITYTPYKINSGTGPLTTVVPNQSSFRPYYSDYGTVASLYVVINQQTTGQIDLYRSTDQGKTWASVLQLPTSSDDAKRHYYSTYYWQPYLFIGYYRTDGSIGITRYDFNSLTKVDYSGSGLTDWGRFEIWQRNGISAVVIVAQGNVANPNVRYVVLTPPATWGPVTTVPFTGFSDGIWCGSSRGSSDRVHHFVRTPAGVYHHNYVLANDVKGTSQVLGVTDTNPCTEPLYISNEDRILVLFRGTPPKSARSQSGTTTPTWTIQTPPTMEQEYRLAANQSEMAPGLSITASGTGLQQSKFEGDEWGFPHTIYTGDKTIIDIAALGLSPAKQKLGTVIRTAEGDYHFLYATQPAGTRPSPAGLYANVQFPTPVDPNEDILPVVEMGTGDVGPWKVGNALYAWGIQWYPNFYGHVFRSLDNGASWECVDQEETNWSGVVCFDRPGNRIIGMQCPFTTGESGKNSFLRDFDLATHTWGAPYGHVLLPDNVRTNNDEALLTVKSNGDLALLYETRPGNIPRVNYRRYSSGVWSANDVVTPGSPTGSYNLASAYMDPVSQNIHFLYQFQPTSTFDYYYYHRIVRDNGSLTVPILLDKQGGNGGVVTPAYNRAIVFFKGKVYIFFVHGSFREYVVKVGTPAAEPVGFTEVIVANANYYSGYMTAFLSADGSRMIALWTDGSGIEGFDYGYSVQIWRTESTDGIKWSDPVLFFDYWGFDISPAFLSAYDIGEGGVDGIGCIVGWWSSQTEYLWKCGGGSSSSAEISNHAY